MKMKKINYDAQITKQEEIVKLLENKITESKQELQLLKDKKYESEMEELIETIKLKKINPFDLKNKILAQ